MDLFGIGAKAVHERLKALHAFALQPVELAETRFKQRRDPHAHRLRDLFVGRVGTLDKRHLEIFRNALELHLFHDVHQRDDHARSSGPSGASRAVDIGFPVVRRFVEEDMGKLGDVDAPRGHVRGDEEADGTLAQTGKHVFPAALRKIGGKLVGIEAEALQDGGHEMDGRLGIAEDNGRGGVFHLKDADKGAILFHAFAFAVHMLHFSHMDLRRGKGKQLRFREEFSGQPQHMGRIRRGEEGSVNPRIREITLDFLHVRIKADGEHPIRFVENERRHMRQRRRWSSTRPGVPTTTLTPCRRASICLP